MKWQQRGWLVPLVVFLVLLVPCVRAAYNYSYATLGRDTGAFQFLAWALSRGQRAYVDVREHNGPLIGLVHRVMLLFGGRDEHVSRLFDIVMQCVAYGIAGLVAAGPWDGVYPTWRSRLSCCAAGVTLLLSQYLVFDWWSTAQRESGYDVFLLVGLSLQLAAQQRLATAEVRPRLVRALLLGSGFLVGATWFGKPTYALCTFGQVAALAADPAARKELRRNVAAIAIGTGAAFVVLAAYVAVVGDLAAYVRIVLLEAPVYYVPIWQKTLSSLYTRGTNHVVLDQGFVTLVALIVGLVLRLVPRSAMITLIPLVFGLVTFFGQRKGFRYHLHPVMLGSYWVWLVALGRWQQGAQSISGWRRRAGGLAFVGLACVCSGKGLHNLFKSDFYDPKWMPAGAGEARETAEFYGGFRTGDFDGYALRGAAAFVRSNVAADRGVQIYGMEPYLLFLAERRSASPFLYSHDLNMDASLAGGPGGKPDEAQRSAILALQERNTHELAEALRRDPAGAFVLMDGAPMTFPVDALVDFRQHCPEAAKLLDDGYVESARFGKFRVFLPR